MKTAKSRKSSNKFKPISTRNSGTTMNLIEAANSSDNGDLIDDDFFWRQNEEVFAAFQENMALIAGNSFEILKLYENITQEYQKVTSKIDVAQERVSNIDLKT